MFWHRLHALLLGTSLVAAQTGAIDGAAPPKVNELLSHECGRAVAELGGSARPAGPLFHEGGLIFTSIEDTAHHPQLLVSAGDGLYRVDLTHAGVNRVRFDLTDPATMRPRAYFLSYLHDPRLGSRYLEFAADVPPVGHFELDYLTVVPRRAAELLPHLEYAIFATSAHLRDGVAAGRVRANPLSPRGACDHLTRENPNLARELARNLLVLDAAAHAPPRQPAAAN